MQKKINSTSIRKYGLNLKFVEEQTKKICLEAVKQCGNALKYVKEQDKEICLRSAEAMRRCSILCVRTRQRDMFALC